MNTRKTILATLFAAAFVAPLAVAPVQAQSEPQVMQRAYAQAELDQMLAPIALYPDALLSQVLMAATYPIEVVEAARWTRANPNLHGDDAVRAVENYDWDPSVKSLVAFPQILQRMDEQINWTESLGDAFLAQESAVMDTVQQLRQRADVAGNLQSSEQIRVERQGPTILIEPASPEYVYVPYYDPLVVYGNWWWPAYRPVYWQPWAGYARHYHRGGSASFWWGRPVGLSVNFFFGNVDWRYRRVHVARPTAYYYRPPVFVGWGARSDQSRWQHDPHHRRGVDYRAAEVRQRFAGAPGERRDAQRATFRQERTEERRDERGLERRDSRDSRDNRQAPQQRQEQTRPEQTRPERREGRDEQQRQRSDARSTERVQQQQRQQQRDQAQAAERAQRQQSEAARIQQQQSQQRQQSEAARAQQQQQRQAAEAARAQQQQQRQQRQEQRAVPAAQAPQQPRAERQERREERRDGRQEQRQEQRQERGQKG